MQRNDSARAGSLRPVTRGQSTTKRGASPEENTKSKASAALDEKTDTATATGLPASLAGAGAPDKKASETDSPSLSTKTGRSRTCTSSPQSDASARDQTTESSFRSMRITARRRRLRRFRNCFTPLERSIG